MTAPWITWSGLAAAYLAAKAAEDAYDREYCAFDRTLPVGPERSAAVVAIPKAHQDEAQRLMDVRCELEDRLLDWPSPSPEAFALKVLICRADGRDLNGLDDMLEREAREIVCRAAFSAPTTEGAA